MINQFRSTVLPRRQEVKSMPISEMYDEIMRNFDQEALRIRFKFSNPTFDDTLLVRPKKNLPKIDNDPDRKARLKFYSHKLVVNQGALMNEKRQLSTNQAMDEHFNKIAFPQPKEMSVLSDRNKRIMQLYRRAQKDILNSPTRIRFTDKIPSIYTSRDPENNKKQKKDEKNMENTLMKDTFKKTENTSQISDQKMIGILREASERKRQQLQVTIVSITPQRSKSNIIINLYQNEQQNQELNTLGKKIEEKDEERRKILRKITYEPKREPAMFKRRFNWKNQPLTVARIDREELLKLVRCYLGIGDPVPIHLGFYKAYIGYGNNCGLIKKLLKDRGSWTIVQSLDQSPNFVWTQTKFQKFSNSLPTTPKPQSEPIDRQYKMLPEGSPQLLAFIKSKRNEYVNGCEKLFESTHFLALMNQIKVRFQNGNNILYFSRLSQVYLDYLQESRPIGGKELKASEIRLHNHMDSAAAIGDKKELLYMMTKFCQIFDQNINELIPTTVHLETFEDNARIFQTIPEGPWILKPGEATNRGTGITIHTSRDSLLAELGKKKKHKNGVKFTNIIQKYVEPLVYNGRKFDIRIWVLWSGGRLWWYREGYLRTSSKQFTLKNMNKFIHLTNDAIQSQSQQFGKFQPANKLSFNQFEKYLESQHNYRGFHSSMLVEMKKLAVKVFRIGNLVFDNQNRQHNFQLFGLDFLIDNKLRPWLIECNTNPCLQINCSLLSRLVPNMLDNLLTLTLDSYFPTPLKRRSKQAQAWNHQQFKFELLYNGNTDTQVQEIAMTRNILVQYSEHEPEFQEIQKQLGSLENSDEGVDV